jgi:hypothetical protein
MGEMTAYDEERIAELLRLLPAVPEGLVRAAQELPSARAEIDGIVARAEEDSAYRSSVIADLDAALEAEGLEPTPSVVSMLRAALGAD